MVAEATFQLLFFWFVERTFFYKSKIIVYVF